MSTPLAKTVVLIRMFVTPALKSASTYARVYILVQFPPKLSGHIKVKGNKMNESKMHSENIKKWKKKNDALENKVTCEKH